MKDFFDFAKEIKEHASGNNYCFQNHTGKLGAYGLTKADIYNAGYSLDGYAPRGSAKLTVLPRKVFLREHFLQDKLFILLCRKLKALIREHAAGALGSMGNNDDVITDSSIIACSVLNQKRGGSAFKDVIKVLEKNALKNCRKNDISYYAKRFNGYDLTSVK